jgi:phosphohistidine phosphatase
MDFYLVRHGEAQAGSNDPRRPLSARGRREVEAVAGAAAAKKISVAAIVHSDKLRARETAEIFARLIAPANGVRQITGVAPEDDPEIAKAELEAAASPVMIVGHLPHLARLASLLLTGDSERPMVEFSTATIACLSWNGESWKFSWIISPEELSRG